MFYKNLNLFGILTFESNNYNKILKAIKDSKAYISFVESSKDKGTLNKRYENYVMLKQAAYTFNAPKRNKDSNTTSIYSLLTPQSISTEMIDKFLNEHGMNDDFEYEYGIEHSQESVYTATHKVIPIEYSTFHLAVDLDNHYEQLNRRYLNDTFLFNNYQRFFLIPFLGKYENKYVKPVVIVNVYDVGIITIQLSIAISKGKIEITNKEPNSIQLTDVEFYQEKNNFSKKDYWKRKKVDSVTIYQIMDYYFDLLKLICKKQELVPQSQKQIAWVLGDFEPNKRSLHKEFVDKNKGLYVSYLTNAQKDIIERMPDEYLDEYLNKTIINKYNTMHFYCSDAISLLSFSHSAFHKEAVAALKENEKELKKEKVYDQALSESYIQYSMFYMSEFLRFYELTFIKRFYALKLLNSLSSSSFNSLKEYNSNRKEFNALKRNYDEQLLFKTYGSPMELYINILEKSGTDKIVDKVEKLFTSAREDISSAREFAIKQSETYILIISSILTVLLGYRGIQYLVEGLLFNLPFKVGEIIALHPFRWTVSLWLILCFSMLILNLIRFKAIKK